MSSSHSTDLMEPGGSPSSPTIPAPVTPPPLGVKGQSSTTIPAPATSSWTQSSTTNPGGDGLAAGGLEDPISTSSPSPEPEPLPVEGRHSLKDMARGVVLAVSARIAASVARDEDEAAVAALMATDKEQKAIGDPIAAIGSRHMKTQAANPDVADLIVAGIAVVGYAFRVATTMWNLKRARAALAAATNDPEEGASS